jgi:hypothetical protein
MIVNEVFTAMQPLLDLMRRQDEVIQTALAPLFAITRRQQEAIQPFIDRMCQQQEAIQTALEPLSAHLRWQQEVIRSITAPLLKTLERAGQAKPGVTKYLLERGWCVTYQFTPGLVLALDDLRQKGDHAEADALMAEFARRLLPEVEPALCGRFPDRARILVEAFEAHRAGKYALSVPALLAQADGVGCDILDIRRQSFPQKNRLEARQKKLGAFTLLGKPYTLHGIMREMLEPLVSPWSLAEDTDKRDLRQASEPWFGPLNRHDVLHGHDTDYPTEQNSLRCVVLLQYLLDVDKILHQEIPEDLARLNELWEEALAAEEGSIGKQGT